jgi:hypothetical protein
MSVAFTWRKGTSSKPRTSKYKYSKLSVQVRTFLLNFCSKSDSFLFNLAIHNLKFQRLRPILSQVKIIEIGAHKTTVIVNAFKLVDKNYVIVLETFRSLKLE